MDHILTERQPKVLQMDADWTNLLAVAAQGTAKDRVAEEVERFP